VVTIFLDVIWLFNFLFDFILLLITRIFIKANTSMKRISFGAFIASLIVPLTILYPHSFIATFLGKLIYSIIIVFSSFSVKSITSFFHTLFSFYFISFVIGGGLFGLHYLLHRPILLHANGMVTFQKAYGDPISWLFIFVSFPLIGYFTKRRLDKYTVEKVKFEYLYPVWITINGKQKRTLGYLDSGNQLIDPITKYPVIVCDEPFLKNWFTKEEWSYLASFAQTFQAETLPNNFKYQIHLIPYRGVTGTNELLLAIKPNEIIVEKAEQHMNYKNVFVGIQFSQLSQDGRFHCLLHPKLFQH